MHYIYCHRTNHTIENYKVKRKEDFVPTIFEVTTQQIKVQKPVKYFCHICGDTGHKIINCPKYNDMKNMFKNKGVKTIEKPYVVEPKVANPSIHVMDINMAITKEQGY